MTPPVRRHLLGTSNRCDPNQSPVNLGEFHPRCERFFRPLSQESPMADRGSEDESPVVDPSDASMEGFTSAAEHLKSPAAEPSSGSGEPSEPIADESPLRSIGVAIGLGLVGVLVPFVVITVLAVVLFIVNPPGLSIFIGLLVIGQFALFVAVGLGYLYLRGFDRQQIIAYVGVARPSLRDIGLILVTWIAMLVASLIVAVVVTEVLPALLGTAEETEPAENPVTEIIAENPELIVIGIVGMFLVVGPAEEILFRGVIQNRLRERLSAVPAIIIASAVFALAHVVAFIGQDPVGIAMTLAILFVPSLGLGAIYEYTENLVVPTLLHGFHNSVILLAVYAAAVIETATVWPMLFALAG